MLDMGFLHYLNPLNYISPSSYTSLVHYILSTIFKGFGAKVLSFMSFIYAFWALLRRESVPIFLTFLLFSLIFAYAGGVISLLF